MEKKLLLQNGLGLPHLLPLRTSFGNLCVISPRVCRTIKWLTPIVLKGMLHGPVKGRVSLQSGTEMLEELQKRLWSLTVSSFLFGKPWSTPVHYKLYGGEKKKKKPEHYHMPSDFFMWQPICVLTLSFCDSESNAWQFKESRAAYGIWHNVFK